jgi:hypothetical protein
MIRLLLLLYPRGWRERYGDEVTDMVASEGLRPSDVLDLVRAGLGARLHAIASAFNRGAPMTARPIHRHPTAWAIAGLVVLLPTAAFVAGSLAAHQLGLAALRGPMDRVAEGIGSFPGLDLLLTAAPLIALGLAALPLMRIGTALDRDDAAAVIQLRLRRANLAVIGAALAIGAVLAWYAAGELRL